MVSKILILGQPDTHMQKNEAGSSYFIPSIKDTTRKWKPNPERLWWPQIVYTGKRNQVRTKISISAFATRERALHPLHFFSLHSTHYWLRVHYILSPKEIKWWPKQTQTILSFLMTLSHTVPSSTQDRGSSHLPLPTCGAMASASGQGVFLKNLSVNFVQLETKQKNPRTLKHGGPDKRQPLYFTGKTEPRLRKGTMSQKQTQGQGQGPLSLQYS